MKVFLGGVRGGVRVRVSVSVRVRVRFSVGASVRVRVRVRRKEHLALADGRLPLASICCWPCTQAAAFVKHAGARRMAAQVEVHGALHDVSQLAPG